MQTIRKMAFNSSNLKSTYIKILREASASILNAAENMTTRPSSLEIRILQRTIA